MNPWTRTNLTSAISLLHPACFSGWMLFLVWLVASHSSPVCFSTSTALFLCADWSPTSSPPYFPLVTASSLQVTSDSSLVAQTDICNWLPCNFSLLWLISSECTPPQTDCKWIIQAPSPWARSIPVCGSALSSLITECELKSLWIYQSCYLKNTNHSFIRQFQVWLPFPACSLLF